MKNTGVNIVTNMMFAVDQSISSGTHGTRGVMPPAITNLIGIGTNDDLIARTCTTAKDTADIVTINALTYNQ